MNLKPNPFPVCELETKPISSLGSYNGTSLIADLLFDEIDLDFVDRRRSVQLCCVSIFTHFGVFFILLLTCFSVIHRRRAGFDLDFVDFLRCSSPRSTRRGGEGDAGPTQRVAIRGRPDPKGGYGGAARGPGPPS